MYALVTDAHLRTAVAGIRQLGRAGIDVIAAGPAPGAAGLWSRFTRVREHGLDVLADPAGFRAAVVRLADLHGPVVLYPCQEASLDAVLDAADECGEVVLPWPGREPLAALRDKRALPAAAAAAGVATPAVHYEGPAAQAAHAAMPFPALAKPVHPSAEFPRPLRLESEADVAKLPGGDVIVQDLVDGPLTAVVVLVAPDGDLVASLQQEALRTWPPGAGPSALAVTVEPDHDLIDRSRALLAGCGYWGLAELQYLRGASGPSLIDVNTRFYGSLPLALRAGVNFPALWHAVAGGRRPAAPAGYRVGVSFRWVEADLSEAARGRLAPLAQRGPRPRSGAFWALDDPVPAGLLAADAVQVRGRRRLR